MKTQTILGNRRYPSANPEHVGPSTRMNVIDIEAKTKAHAVGQLADLAGDYQRHGGGPLICRVGPITVVAYSILGLNSKPAFAYSLSMPEMGCGMIHGSSMGQWKDEWEAMFAGVKHAGQALEGTPEWTDQVRDYVAGCLAR